jgi:acetoin utilization protein AcuB
MSLEKIMTTDIISLELDADLSQARAIFSSHKIHHILITNQKILVGVITDRDLYKHLSPTIGTNKETHQDNMILTKKIHLIMNRDLVTATPETQVNDSVLLFHDNHISCLPIVNKQFQPIGIITWRDVLKVIAQQYRKRKAKNIS